VIIKFKNWGKYNGRKGVERPTWFRLDNSLLTDTKVYGLEDDEFRAFIYLLCENSKSGQRNETFVEPQHARIQGRISNQTLNRTIKKLKSLQIIEVRTLRGCFTSVPQVCPTDRQTIQTDTTNTPPELPAPEFDFEEVYKKYPRKEGKTRGFKVCRRDIKTAADFDALQRAVARYTSHVRKNGTEVKFMKIFSTFMGEWRDWTEPETGGAMVEESTPEAIRIEKLAQEAERNARLQGN
jgi:hypothetical protein